MPQEIFKNQEGEKYTLEVEISREEIQEITKRLGKQITADYKDKKLVLVGILKGAHVFLADLEREIDNPLLEIDFMDVSSYGNGTDSSGNPRINRDISTDVAEKEVLVVEDIADTGYSLSSLLGILRVKGASSVEVAVLFSKPSRRQVDVPIKYIGKEISDIFVVGNGLDYQQKHRNLPNVEVVHFENPQS